MGVILAAMLKQKNKEHKCESLKLDLAEMNMV